MKSHLLISDNTATGVSINFSPDLVCPAQCPYCYCARRTKAQANKLCDQLGIARGLITSNNGPITWDGAQRAYRRNVDLLARMSLGAIEREALRIAVSLERRGYDNIRVGGAGDLFPAAVRLCVALGQCGIQAYGFSKKPGDLYLLAELSDRQISPDFVRPRFYASIDRWTSQDEVAQRIYAARAVLEVSQTAPVLAYMALADEKLASIKSKWFWSNVAVVLGYHATATHTRIGIARECPKTAGRGVTCQECRRCIGKVR